MSFPNSFRAAVPAAKAVLSVRRLRVAFPPVRRWPRSGAVQAVDDLHFDLAAGETLGVLGEPGCGKTSLARALTGLQAIEGGGVVFDGRDLARTPEGWAPVRRRIQMLFSNARDSLDPRLTVAQSIAEPLEVLCPELGDSARAARVLESLESVAGTSLADRKPRDLSDGDCQSACLARALAVRPDVLVCDEPAQALGTPSRTDLLEVIRARQDARGMAVVMCASRPEMLAQLCERVLVMSLGRILEQGEALEMFARPRHPYTRALLAGALQGELPDPLNPPSGCVFRTRCAMADELCARETPYLRRVSESGHAACHYVHGAADEESVGEARTRS